MLVSMKTILNVAKHNGFGVAAPNVFNAETVEAAFLAAKQLKSPIILDGAEVHGIEKISCLAKYYSGLYPEVVAALNLDHGASFEVAIKAIRCGYTSIMVDRSTLDYESNVKEVKELVKIAHAVGVSVEAELGHVGQGYEYEKTRDSGLTNPEQAIQYVKETEIDALAVAIGTSHGTYKGTPHLEFELLSNLHNSIFIPLVLHGGSGTGDENLRKAVQTGIQKINLFTDLSNSGVKYIRSFVNGDTTRLDKNFETGSVEKKQVDMFSAFEAGAEGYKEKLMYYMKLFGSDYKDMLYR